MPLAGSSLQQMSEQPAPRYCLAERADRRHVRRSHRFAYVLREVDRALRVALSECAVARVLVPHGRLVVSTHGLMFHHPDPKDYWRWTPAGLRRALSESGLEVEWLRGVVGTPAFDIQLASDGLYYKLGSRMRPALSLATNSLMAVVDSMTSRESKDADAVVIVAQATIPA